MKQYRADVVIIGGGLSALVCAYRLRDSGLKIIILSRGAGASPDISGFNMPLHESDSKESFVRDTLASGQGQSDPDLVQALADDSAGLLSLFDEIGFHPDKDSSGALIFRRPLGAAVPRVVGQGNKTGIVLLDLLHNKIKQSGDIEFFTGFHALRLLCGTRGNCSGVLAYDSGQGCFASINANAALLACGGFCKIFPFSTNSPDIGGDGIAMAYEAGLPLVDLEFVQFEPSAAVYPDPVRGRGVITTLMYEGAVLRNVHGERFMLQYDPAGEQVNKDIMALRIYQEIAKGNGTVHGGVFFDATAVEPGRLDTIYDIFVERYRRCGMDIHREAMEVAPAPHTSLGGVETAPDCSTAVKGLFVCGEAMGALHGANRIGGNAGLETLVFGSRAASSVKNYLGANPEESAQDNADEFLQQNSSAREISAGEIKLIRSEMETQLDKSLNVIRNGPDIEAALAVFCNKLESLQKMKASGDPALFMKFRLENDLRTAQLLAYSALERKESAGCHVRSDSIPQTGCPYRIRIRKNSGNPLIEHIRIKQNAYIKE